MNGPSGRTFDVNVLIEGVRFDRFLFAVTAVLFLALFFDGLDFTMLGNLMPVVAKSFHASRGAVTAVLAVNPIGAALGGLLGGALGDRWGRRRTLSACMLLFGVATLGMALAPSMLVLGGARILAGIGLGGATPNAASLMSELIPRRLRSLVMSSAFIGFPLGAAANGLVIPAMLPHFGWRGVAAFGAVAPLVVLLVLAALVPESPGFLVSRPGRRKELAALLNRLLPGRGFSEGDRFVISKPAINRVGVRALLSPVYRRDTVCLWLAGFANQFAAVSLSSWATTALTAAGFGYFTAVRGLMADNLAGAGGALVGGWAIGRFGSRRALPLFAVLGAVTAFVLFALTRDHGAVSPALRSALLLGAMALIGVSISGVQLGQYPLSTHLYPTDFRASGVGWALAVARLGAISAVSATGMVVGAFGPSYLFAVVGLAIITTWGALSLIRSHIVPGPATDARAANRNAAEAASG